MKGKGNKTAKFRTEQEANFAAAEKLNIWVVVKIDFKHEFINHTV